MKQLKRNKIELTLSTEEWLSMVQLIDAGIYKVMQETVKVPPIDRTTPKKVKDMYLNQFDECVKEWDRLQSIRVQLVAMDVLSEIS